MGESVTAPSAISSTETGSFVSPVLKPLGVICH